MELVVHIPDSVAASLSVETNELARDLLETYAIESYKSGKLTSYQVQQLLGLETRMDVDAFLKAHGVPLELTLEDVEAGRKALDALLGRREVVGNELPFVANRFW